MAENSDNLEVEWQFDTPDLTAIESWLRRQSPQAPLSLVDQGEAVQHDTYFDTEDWAIYRAGFTLRSRRFEARAEVTLKSQGSPSDGQRSRREINQSLPDPEANLFDADGPVTQRVKLLARGQEPLQLFTVTTRRRNFKLQHAGETVAVLSLDEADFGGGDSEQSPLRRVEIEQTQPGSSPLLKSFVDALTRAANMTPATLSKFESGLVAARLLPRVAPNIGSTLLSAEYSTYEYACATLRRFFAEFVAHEPGTRLGEDPEELHDMRVSARRLRAALSTFAPALPPRFQEFRAELQWVAQALGSVRDLDVQLESFRAMQEHASWEEGSALGALVDAVQESRQGARANLLEVLDSQRFAALIESMTAALSEEAPDPAATAEAVPIPIFAVAMIRKRYRQFRRDARLLTPESAPAEYHAERVRTKKLRYTVEFMQSLYGPPASELAKALAKLQDLLGDHQDCQVAIDWLGSLAADENRPLPASTLLYMGELRQRSRTRMEELRAQWPDEYRKVKRSWRRLRWAIRLSSGTSDSEPEDEVAGPLPPRRFGPLIFFRRLAGRAARPDLGEHAEDARGE